MMESERTSSDSWLEVLLWFFGKTFLEMIEENVETFDKKGFIQKYFQQKLWKFQIQNFIETNDKIAFKITFW